MVLDIQNCPYSRNLLLMVHLICFTVGWGTTDQRGFGGEQQGMKTQILNLIRSIRTVMRSKLLPIQNQAGT